VPRQDKQGRNEPWLTPLSSWVFVVVAAAALSRVTLFVRGRAFGSCWVFGTD
jgi:hypothetical protein